MTDVTMTRGVGFQDDMAGINVWTAQHSANVTASNSTDGDIMTVTGVFTSAVNGNYANAVIADPLVGGNVALLFLDLGTFVKVMIRYKAGSGVASNPQLQLLVAGTSGYSQTFILTPNGTNWTVETFPLTGTAGVNLESITIFLAATANLTGTFTVQVDFVRFFKEILVLPAVSQPSGISATRNLIELPIPGREGGILQDLGSSTLVITLNGVLSTTSPNNPSPNSNSYTGLQWVQVLLGVWLEQGNPLTTYATVSVPIWQYLTMDAFNYKVVILLFKALQQPGRPDYWDFSLTIKLMPLLGMTAQALGAIQ